MEFANYTGVYPLLRGNHRRCFGSQRIRGRISGMYRFPRPARPNLSLVSLPADSPSAEPCYLYKKTVRRNEIFFSTEFLLLRVPLL